ncbi:MAG: M20/M25/M40 family metallo-hydrolase, partial [Chloroflexi bacterium]|nr:M20/M25/M40 family metallo-hydrolase [Chloroflexota bacterium]
DANAMLADLAALESITQEHGGARAAGGDGYAAAADWVADELRAAGYEVTLDPVFVPLFAQTGPGELEILAPGAPALEGPRDFKAMLLSPSGDVAAPLFALGFDPDARPEDRNGIGCDADAWGGVPAGAIVLVQPGPCRARQTVVNAQAAGAVALISSYPMWEPDQVRRPTLLDPAGLTIPVVAVTRDAGLALADAAAAGHDVHLSITTTTDMRPSDNVIAETPGGDPDHILMLGAHLDSALDGPGINDNGSGNAAVLEIARRLAALSGGQPGWKVRVAFWTGEEIGLWGSVQYADSLNDADRRAIAAYLNLDMIATPGGPRQVYDAATLNSASSSTLERLFGQAFDGQGLAWEKADYAGASDHYRFDELGIPVGGIGSVAGIDPCYHLACDTLDGVDPVLLEQMTRAAAWVTGYLAAGERYLEP